MADDYLNEWVKHEPPEALADESLSEILLKGFVYQINTENIDEARRLFTTVLMVKHLFPRDFIHYVYEQLFHLEYEQNNDDTAELYFHQANEYERKLLNP